MSIVQTMSIVSSSGMFVNKETTSNDTMKQLRAFLPCNRLTKSKLSLRLNLLMLFRMGSITAASQRASLCCGEFVIANIGRRGTAFL